MQTAGDNVITVEIEDTVGHINIGGAVTATGTHSDAIHVRANVAGLDALTVHATDGQDVVHND